MLPRHLHAPPLSRHARVIQAPTHAPMPRHAQHLSQQLCARLHVLLIRPASTQVDFSRTTMTYAAALGKCTTAQWQPPPECGCLIVGSSFAEEPFNRKKSLQQKRKVHFRKPQQYLRN